MKIWLHQLVGGSASPRQSVSFHCKKSYLLLLPFFHLGLELPSNVCLHLIEPNLRLLQLLFSLLCNQALSTILTLCVSLMLAMLSTAANLDLSKFD